MFTWLPERGKIRTFFTLTVFAGTNHAWTAPGGRFFHRVEDAQSSSASPARAVAHGAKLRRNPAVLAREWEARLADGTCASRAELARALGVSRPRVTQVLKLLTLPPQVCEAITALGDPLPGRVITEHWLRRLLTQPAEHLAHELLRAEIWDG
jgi:hypothetical protein